MSIIKNLYIAMTYGKELESLVKEQKAKLEQEIYERNRHRLKLCEKHNPDDGLTNYSHHNCDYCRLEKEVNRLKGILNANKIKF